MKRMFIVATIAAAALFAGSRSMTHAQQAFAPVYPNSASAALAGSLAEAIPDAAERAVRSVVAIKTSRTISQVQFDPFGGTDVFEMPQQMGEGSGVILTAQGRIVTNAHVIRGADKVKVVLHDGTELEATVVGSDPRTDIAVLQTKGSAKLIPMVVGDSNKLRLGEVVLAIGNPFGVGHSVSMGIISAKNRRVGIEAVEDFLQTDASINPGNSGGALINLRGELIGINTAIASQTSAGVGFAIPTATMMMPIVDMIVKDGKVSRGYLGVQPVTLTEELARKVGANTTRGVILRSVEAGSPAAKAGLMVKDIVTAINGVAVTDETQLRTIVGMSKVGTQIVLDVIRPGQNLARTVNIKLEAFPDDATPPQRQRRQGPRLMQP